MTLERLGIILWALVTVTVGFALAVIIVPSPHPEPVTTAARQGAPVIGAAWPVVAPAPAPEPRWPTIQPAAPAAAPDPAPPTVKVATLAPPRPPRPPPQAEPAVLRLPPPPPARLPDRLPDQGPADAAITIAAVGDVMIGMSVNHTARVRPPWPALDPRIAAALRASDLAIGNLEGVIVDPGFAHRRCGSDGCYRFRMDRDAADRLRAAGFTHLNLANNHSDDFLEPGKRSTLAELDRVGIAYGGLARIGAESHVGRYAGLRVGFTGFSPNLCCLDLLDTAAMQALVADLKRRSDLVVVAFHGGAEGEAHGRVRRVAETYLGEARGDVFAFARAAIDAGADLVLGSGPHVPRAMEVYRGRLIAYSLGNFWTPVHVSLGGPGGLAPLLQVRLARDGRLVEAAILSARQGYGLGPVPDAEGGALAEIRRLTALDFPERPAPLPEMVRISSR